MSADVLVRKVRGSLQEISAAVHERYPFVVMNEGEVNVHGVPLAALTRDGPRLLLSGRDATQPYLRWVGWAVAQVIDGAEAFDPARNVFIAAEPMSQSELTAELHELAGEKGSRRMDDDEKSEAAEAEEEARALLDHLVEKELLVGGPWSGKLLTAVGALLQDVKKTTGDELENLLMDASDVEELFADGSQLTEVVMTGDYLPAPT